MDHGRGGRGDQIKKKEKTTTHKKREKDKKTKREKEKENYSTHPSVPFKPMAILSEVICPVAVCKIAFQLSAVA